MNFIKPLILCIVLISICSCGKKIQLGSFNPTRWQGDFNGCDGNREIQLRFLNGLKKDFEGLSESQLISILGKPNKQELKERNCKSYYYFAAPGKQCIMENKETKIPYVIVEMNAISYVSLVRFALED